MGPDDYAIFVLEDNRKTIYYNKVLPIENAIIASAKAYDPAKITHYVQELATKFHKFYSACRVKGEDEKLTQARLSLCAASATTIKNVLSLMKINAPEKM